ncbi:hypothetical protein DFH07DRAFT_1016311, partial [Mycena maculata]
LLFGSSSTLPCPEPAPPLAHTAARAFHWPPYSHRLIQPTQNCHSDLGMTGPGKAPGISTKGWSPNFLKSSLKKPLIEVVWGLKKPLSDNGNPEKTSGAPGDAEIAEFGYFLSHFFVKSDIKKPLLGQDHSDFSLKKPHFGQQNRKFSASKSHFCGPSFGGASQGLPGRKIYHPPSTVSRICLDVININSEIGSELASTPVGHVLFSSL